MIIDTSAVVCVLRGETGAARPADIMNSAGALRISATSVLEVSIVLESRFGEIASSAFRRWLGTSSVEVVPLTADQVGAAFDGFRRFGKGRHPAGLNFGNCFSYRLAKVMGEAILFVEKDFGLTDLVSAG